MINIFVRLALMGVAELAKGIEYTDPIKTSWRPPRIVQRMSEQRHQRIRQIYNIIVEGDDIPPPLCRFEVNFLSTFRFENLCLLFVFRT